MALKVIALTTIFIGGTEVVLDMQQSPSALKNPFEIVADKTFTEGNGFFGMGNRPRKITLPEEISGKEPIRKDPALIPNN